MLLPPAAWEIAGEGDPDRLAVAPGHEKPYQEQGIPVDPRDGWVAVGPTT